jgi:hypothetical protein
MRLFEGLSPCYFESTRLINLIDGDKLSDQQRLDAMQVVAGI